MTEYNRSGARDLSAFLATTGTQTDPSPQGKGLTLGVASYYFPVGNDRACVPQETTVVALHVKWDSAVTGVFTFETSNFPQFLGGHLMGGIDVSDYDTVAGNWMQETPTTADVSITSTDASTGGASVSSLTVTVAGGTAGGFLVHLGNLGSRRLRLKATLTVGGVVRVSESGKLGA